MFAWKIAKQSGTAHHTNGSEIRAFFTGVKRTIVFRRFFESLGKIIKGPTISYEDNNAAIQQMHADKLTPRIKHLDIMMTWLHEQHTYQNYVAVYCNTSLNKADMNTKAHGGQTLQEKHLCMVGYKFYPPKGSEHYEILELGKYNIGIHRGSFLLEPGKTVYKPKVD